MKQSILPGVLLICVAALLVTQCNTDAAWRRQVAEANARYDTLALTHQRTDAAVAAKDSALEERARELDAREALMRSRQRETANTALAVTDSVLASLPDTCRLPVERITAAWQEHLVADSLAGLAIDSARHHLENALVVVRNQRETYRVQRDDALQLARDNLKLARPSRFWQGVLVGAALVGGLVVVR